MVVSCRCARVFSTESPRPPPRFSPVWVLLCGGTALVDTAMYRRGWLTPPHPLVWVARRVKEGGHPIK